MRTSRPYGSVLYTPLEFARLMSVISISITFLWDNPLAASVINRTAPFPYTFQRETEGHNVAGRPCVPLLLGLLEAMHIQCEPVKTVARTFCGDSHVARLSFLTLLVWGPARPAQPYRHACDFCGSNVSDGRPTMFSFFNVYPDDSFAGESHYLTQKISN